LIDRLLYLPQKWISNPERCKKAGISPEARRFRTKAQLGLEMILQAKRRAIPFAFVGMDVYYGEQPWFLSLEQASLVYVADIPCNTRAYLEYPEIEIPKRKGERGRVPGKPKVLQGKPAEVRELGSSDSVTWHIVKVRGEFSLICLVHNVKKIVKKVLGGSISLPGKYGKLIEAGVLGYREERRLTLVGAKV
jgi:SRSO17 transposase